MTLQLLTAYLLFATVSSITPGPNNLMLMASGANFGFRRSIPHMLGISLGFMLMVFIVGAGLLQLFDRWPLSYTILKVASVLYLLYLAWQIANAAPPAGEESDARPFTFLQAAAFQWVNPKAWAMALTATSVYTPSRDYASIALIAVLFVLVNLPCISLWTLLGREARRRLNNSRRLRIFNLTMALALVTSLWPVVVGRS